MHRSGTSLLAKMIKDAGIAIPEPVLPGNDDNPEGYWETRSVVTLNNSMLSSIGLDWRDHSPISKNQMAHLIQTNIIAAQNILANVNAAKFAIKDPRLCRLLPVWLAAARKLKLKVKIVAVLRPAIDVAKSLFRRTQDERFKAAGIANPIKSKLLWLRYNLDLIKYSQSCDCSWVEFSDLFGNTYSLKTILEADTSHSKQYFDEPKPSLSCEAGQGSIFQRTYELISQGTDKSGEMITDLDNRFEAYCADGSQIDGPEIVIQARNLGHEFRGVIGFLSGAPESKGHIYRIHNRIEGLINTNYATFEFSEDCGGLEEIVDVCDCIFMFRIEASAWLNRLTTMARTHNVKTVYDIDDLIFLPEFMTEKFLAFLSTKTLDERERWKEKSCLYQKAMKSSDAAFVSTRPLALYAERVANKVYVVPNGLSFNRLRDHSSIPERNSEIITIGFASGTATHDRDFALVVPALREILTKYQNVNLKIIGHLSDQLLAPLKFDGNKVSVKSTVPFSNFPEALSDFDINIAPLELNNPFCNCKSQLKYFEAALVGVPTIASSTEPFKSAITTGVNGYLAESHNDWVTHLSTLIEDAKHRQYIGAAARKHALEDFGPQKLKISFENALSNIVLDD